MRSHVTKTVSACFAVLRQLQTICRSVPRSVLQSLVTSLVLTRHWLSAVRGCQPSVTELFRSPPLVFGTVFRSTPRQHRHWPSFAVASRLVSSGTAFHDFTVLLSCPRNWHVIMDTLMVFITYLLGVHIDSNLSCHTHVEAIVSKATQWLYFLKQLKHAGVSRAQLLHFYISVICPVPEYAVPVWHHLLTKFDSIRSVQKRALRIIYLFSNDMLYSNYLNLADIASLSTRRKELCRKFFHSIVHPTSSLHSLLPPPRDPDLLARLQAPTKFPRIFSQTKKYQSFVSYALSRYQT